jgi:hypothetical protein
MGKKKHYEYMNDISLSKLCLLQAHTHAHTHANQQMGLKCG